MKRNQPIGRRNFEQCSTYGCSIDSLNYCMKGKAFVCNTCAAIMHYDCDLKIKDEKGFVENSMELLKDLVQRMNSIEYVCTFNMSSRNFREELRHIQELINKFERKVKRNPIKIANADNYVDEIRNLLKQVLNSQVYKEYIDYNSRLKISREITRKLEEGDQENELRFINSQFYLKVKEREMESRERLVKSLTQEVAQRINKMDKKIKKLEKGEKESDKKINEINNTIDKNAKSTARNFKELKEITNESFENVQKNNELSLNKISQKLNEETKQIEEVKENQEKDKKKFEKKIKQFVKKQDETNSQIQKDLDKNKANCKKLIEKSSKEAEENTLKLENRVDKIEKKLSDVDKHVNETKEKEKCKDMIKQLELKDDHYYINEFKDYKDFPAAFKKTREVYSKLGQHAYPHQFYTWRQIKINRGTLTDGNKYIYFGQLAGGTDMWDGIGIRVDSSGAILEGCSENNKLNGFGRNIFKSGDYYIGEFKDGSKHGHGTYWWADGMKYVGKCKNNKWDGQGTIYYTNGTKYVGEWKDSKYHGKGTEYTADGQISKEGVWADNKYVGKG